MDDWLNHNNERENRQSFARNRFKSRYKFPIDTDSQKYNIIKIVEQIPKV
jgi:hypothetical protein